MRSLVCHQIVVVSSDMQACGLLVYSQEKKQRVGAYSSNVNNKTEHTCILILTTPIAHGH